MTAEPPAVDLGLTGGLDACEGSLASHLGRAVAVFGSAALGVVDLPPMSGALDPAQIELGGVVLWLSEVERAGLPRFVEALEHHPLRADTSELQAWLREPAAMRAAERLELYSRVLGGPGSDRPNEAFRRAFDAFAATLADRLHTVGDARHLEVRAAVIGRDAATALSSRAQGLVGFVARELVRRLRSAQALLSRGPIARELGGGPLWTLIARHAVEVTGQPLDPGPALDRARTGLALVRLLARSTAQLRAGRLPLPADHPALLDAELWRLRAAVAPTLPELPA